MYKPIGDKVLLEELMHDTRSKIILPDGAKPEIIRCRVVAVGPGHMTLQGLKPLQVVVGDEVYVPRFSAVEVEFNTFKYLICAEDRIFAIIALENKVFIE